MRASIVATFELDGKGRPKFTKHDDLKHYCIRLSLDQPPPDAYAVTYILHETYYDPVRESRDRATSFGEDLTSYGDFTVQAKVRTPERVLTLAVPLSTALTNGHHQHLTQPIAGAIDDIRNL
jgi:hypothetical protein